MEGTFKTPTALVNFVKDFAASYDWSNPCHAKLTGGKRTLSQNNLYWMWMDQFVKHFKLEPTNVYPDTKDMAHDICRNMFLGTEDKVCGKMVIPNQLISTTQLSKNEMSEYMTKVQSFCLDRGLVLNVPAENEYRQYLESRV